MKRMKSIRQVFIVLGGLALLLSACGASATSARDLEYPGAVEEMYLEAEAPAPDASYVIAEKGVSDEAQANASDVERIVIKNADISVVVPDPAASLEAISAMAEEMGGFVVSSNLYQTRLDSGLEVPQASLTVRVPAERLTEALATIESSATQVLYKNEYGQDITREYTDLQSRLRNLEDAAEQLREIMASATKTEDVLDVFQQLTYVTEEIEVLKGQIQYYDEAAALSAISVTLTADEAVQPIDIGGWQPVGVAKDAIQTLLKALRAIGNAVIWFVLFVLPTLLALAIPVVIVILIVRAVVRRRKGKAPKADS